MAPAVQRQAPARARLVAWMAFAAVLALAASPLSAGHRQEQRVREARWSYEKLLDDPRERIPAELLERTRCVAIFPRLVEAAFGFGGTRGLGVASCRNAERRWSPPAFVKLTGGSVGLQAGYKRAEVILFVVSERGARSLLDRHTSLGGEASVALGPLDRETAVSTDRRYDEDIFVYSRSRGVFGGVSVEGSQLAISRKAIRRYYGSDVAAESILFDHEVPQSPPEARPFADGLQELMP